MKPKLVALELFCVLAFVNDVQGLEGARPRAGGRALGVRPRVLESIPQFFRGSKSQKPSYDPQAPSRQNGLDPLFKDDEVEDEEDEDYEDDYLDFDEDDYEYIDEDDDDDEDYLFVEERIREIFPLLDRDGSGKISFVELEDWHYQAGINATQRYSAFSRRHDCLCSKRLGGKKKEEETKVSADAGRRRVEREFSTMDRDGDGHISLKEFVGGNDPRLETEEEQFDTERTKGIDERMLDDRIGSSEWMNTMIRLFHLTDDDGNGTLDKEEYQHFLRPEETGKKELMDHLAKEDVKYASKQHD